MSEIKETGCCPIFDPKLWDGKTLNWQAKKFIKDEVKQIMHVPIGYGKVITGMMQKIDAASAKATGNDFLMLSHDLSAWKSELYVATTKDVPDAKNVTISGTFLSKVFDGPFSQARKFYMDMQKYVGAQGKTAKKYYFYYTTCPKCAKVYGHNYIVVLAQV